MNENLTLREQSFATTIESIQRQFDEVNERNKELMGSLHQLRGENYRLRADVELLKKYPAKVVNATDSLEKLNADLAKKEVEDLKKEVATQVAMEQTNRKENNRLRALIGKNSAYQP